MAQDSQTDRDKKRTRRDLLALLLLLLAVFACLFATAQFAITPAGSWQVPANMLSDLNPDKNLRRSQALVEPLRQEVLTPPAWNLDSLLTPVGKGFVVSPMVFVPVPQGTATPVKVVEVPTSASATATLPVSTPTGTPFPTTTQIPTALPTRTPLPTPVAPSHTPLPTLVPPTDTPEPPPPPPPATATPTSPLPPRPDTVTPTASATPTSPLPPRPDTVTPTATGTATNTPTATGTSTNTPTPTPTSSPTAAGTSTNTPTPTPTTDPPPAAPTGLRAAAGNQQIILGWNPNSESDLAGYRVYSSTIGGLPPYTPHTAVTSARYLNLSLSNGTTYYYYVTAFDAGNNESGPSNIVNAQPYDITPYTYTTTVTCAGVSVSGCNNAGGAPNGSVANITGTGTLELDFGAGHGIMDGLGYDMVFYENPNPNAGGPGVPGIQLDFVNIELSADGTNWYTVFSWDGDNPGDVTGTNIDSYAHDANGEQENEYIPSATLYPGVPPINTGIEIDIGAVPSPPPPGYSYHLVRFTYPAGGSDSAEVDSVRRLS